MQRALTLPIREDRLATTGIIYAIECVGYGAVKIGFTEFDDPRYRFSSLQTSTPFALSIIGFVSGTLKQEQELHFLLRNHRIRNEWFRREGLVENFLSMLPPYTEWLKARAT